MRIERINHYAGPYQALVSTIGLGFAWYFGTHPQTASVQSSIPANVAEVVSMTPEYLRLFWTLGLTLGASALGGLVWIVLEIIQRVRKNGSRSTLSSSNKISDQIELIKFGKIAEGVLTPLQLDAIRLAKELASLSQKAQGSTLSKLIINRLMPDPNINEWQRSIVSEYALDFAPKVRNLALKFGKEGFDEPELVQYFDSIPNAQCLPSIQGNIVRLALKMDGIKVRPE